MKKNSFITDLGRAGSRAWLYGMLANDVLFLIGIICFQVTGQPAYHVAYLILACHTALVLLYHSASKGWAVSRKTQGQINRLAEDIIKSQSVKIRRLEKQLALKKASKKKKQ